MKRTRIPKHTANQVLQASWGEKEMKGPCHHWTGEPEERPTTPSRVAVGFKCGGLGAFRPPPPGYYLGSGV